MFETCEKCGWILEGFCVMTNHFHLVVRTPKGNLIYGMKRLKKTPADIMEEIKSADWKILIAAVLKCKTSATNVWIAEQLNMGVPHAVNRYVGIFKQNGTDQEKPFQILIANITT